MATAALAGPVGANDAPAAAPAKLQDPADLEGLALPKIPAGDPMAPTSVDAAASATRAARQARLAAFIAEREAQAAARAAAAGAGTGAGGNAGPDARPAPPPKPRSEANPVFDSPPPELDKSAAEKENTGKVPDRVSYSGPAGDGRSSSYDSGASQRSLSESLSPQQRDLAREAVNYVKGLMADPLTWFLLIPVGLGVAVLAVMARRG